MKKLLLLLTLSLSSQSWGAVAFVNTNTVLYNGSGSISAAQSVTDTGSNRVAFVCVTGPAASAPTYTVSYGGQSMTSAGSQSYNTNSSYFYEEVFYLVNPPTGSNTLAVSNGGSTEVFAVLTAFQGVNQTTPVRSGTYQSPDNQTTDANGEVSITVTSNTDDLTYSCANGGASWPMITTNQTRDAYDTGSGTMQIEQDHATTAASSVTHTWDNGSTSGENATIIGFSISGISSGGSTLPQGVYFSPGNGSVTTR